MIRELMMHESARCCGGGIVAGPAPRAVRLHVWSLRKRCAKLMDWMGGDPALATAITLMGDLPSTPDLVEVRACLQRVSRRVLQEEDRGRLEAWKESMNRKWTTRRKEVYCWIRGVEDRPLTVLARPNGTLTGNIEEMDELV